MATEGRQYRPGRRSQPEYSSAREAWLKGDFGSFILMVYDPDDRETSESDFDFEPEAGPTVRLLIARPKQRTPLTVSLSRLTIQDLTLMREFFEYAFGLVEPICAKRDKDAQDAFSRGNDAVPRQYRRLSQLVIRQGKKFSHRKGVHNTIVGDADGAGGAVTSPGGVRGNGAEVADGEPAPSEPQNDSLPTDGPKSLRNLGGTGADPDGLQSPDTCSDDSSPAA